MGKQEAGGGGGGMAKYSSSIVSSQQMEPKVESQGVTYTCHLEIGAKHSNESDEWTEGMSRGEMVGIVL